MAQSSTEPQQVWAKRTDIVAASGDSLTDIHATEKVVFAMKNGMIYKQERE